MVRVGSLFDIARISPDAIDNKSGMNAREQLQKIYSAVPALIAQKKRSYTILMETLRENSVEDLQFSELKAGEIKTVNTFFKNEMLPLLSPIIIGPHHPVPHLVNKHIYAAALLEDRKGRSSVGIIGVPPSLPMYVPLSENNERFIRTENILLHWAPTLFGTYTVKESCLLSVTRNADISFDEEKFEDSEKDFRDHLSKLLKKRDRLSIVRLELGEKISDDFLARLSDLLNVEAHQIFIDETPLNMSYVYRLADKHPKAGSLKLLYHPYTARWPEDIIRNQSIISQIQKRDRLLFYPFDSVEPFLSLLAEAAENPNVLSIKITIYRLASSSRVAHILSRAAENGKEVLVLMELRARFDEANNLAWSRLLEESGCQVIYGMEGFKCHSKVCLITMRTRGKMNYITQIGTGNYNESTNAMYTDLSLMSASAEIGEDAAAFFRNMLINNLEGQYNELLVSPYGIKSEICELIDEQISLGSEGYICIKANSVTERVVIDKLCEASQAGVEIRLIIRGICCILPGIAGYTDNIHVTSIVGRYLEHARIFLFGRGDNPKVYISSADLMTRNLDRRVETACPVYSNELRERLKWILSCQLKDTAKASSMLPDGTYLRKHGTVPFNSQDYFMDNSPHTAALISEPQTGAKDGLMKTIRDRICRVLQMAR